MKKQMINTRELSMMALFIALTCVGTLVVRIPFPLTNGYLNLGDAVLMAGALVAGRRVGLMAGGVGSFMADLLTGYAYAPATLIIKGLEGFLCGVVFERMPTKQGRVLAVLIGALVMAGGYFVFECFLVGVYTSALSAAANLGQGLAGAFLAHILAAVLEKAMGDRRLSGHRV